MMNHSPFQKRETFEKVLPIFYHYRWMLISATATYILFNMIGLVMPWVLKITIDRVLPNADYLLFWFMCGALVIIYLVRFLLRYVATYLMDYAGIRLIVDVRQKVFKHLQSLSLRFYQEYRTGKLISNMISDVALLNMLIRTVTQFGEQFFQLILQLLIEVFLLFFQRIQAGVHFAALFQIGFSPLGGDGAAFAAAEHIPQQIVKFFGHHSSLRSKSLSDIGRAPFLPGHSFAEFPGRWPICSHRFRRAAIPLRPNQRTVGTATHR